jgi:hypothetical protein
MDGNTAILGAVTPALVALAEVLNPVSEKVINSQLFHGKAKQVVRQTGRGPDAVRNFDRDVENVAKLVATTAGSAVEVSALIPTWIGVTAGLTTVMIELTPIYYVYLLVLWTLIWAILGMKFFATIDYQDMASFRSYIPTFRGLTGSKGLSVCIIVANLFVIAIIIATWWFTQSPPKALIPGKAAAFVNHVCRLDLSSWATSQDLLRS